MSEEPKKLYGVGIHYDIPAEEYHADCCVEPSLSHSLGWTLANRAPIHGFLEHPRLNPEHKPRDTNDAMDFGSLAHELLLGQEGRVVIGQWDDFKKKEAQLWRDQYKAIGKIPVLQKTYDRAVELCDCAKLHINACGYGDDFSRAKSEVTVIGKTEDGIYLRSRFDKLLIDPDGAKDRQHSETVLAFDVKITKDASPEFCKRQVGKMGYDLQKVHYTKALSLAEPSFAGKSRWTFLFIENSFPFCVTPIELSNGYEAIGNVRFERALSRWKQGVQKNSWPTFCEGQGAFMVNPPRYLEMQELEDEL